MADNDVLLTAILSELQRIRALLEPVHHQAKIAADNERLNREFMTLLSGGEEAEGPSSTVGGVTSPDGALIAATEAYPGEWDKPENVKPVTLWTFDPEAADSWYVDVAATKETPPGQQRKRRS